MTDLSAAYDTVLGIIEIARTEDPETAFSRLVLQRARSVRATLEAALAAQPPQLRHWRTCEDCGGLLVYDKADVDAALAVAPPPQQDDLQHDPLCSLGQQAGDQTMPCDCDGVAAPPPPLRERELEWVLDRAEAIVRDEHGKDAAYAFTQAWTELPKELRTPLTPLEAKTAAPPPQQDEQLVLDLRWWADRVADHKPPTPWEDGLSRLLRKAADALSGAAPPPQQDEKLEMPLPHVLVTPSPAEEK